MLARTRGSLSIDATVLRRSGQPLFMGGERVTGFRSMGADNTDEFDREAETEKLMRFDLLTGLGNRHPMAYLIDTTLTAFKAARRNCAVMMFDLDRFKHGNYAIGHAAGDELLKQAADRTLTALFKFGVR